MTSSLDKIAAFNPASTNINRYLERLEQYFIAKGVPADTGERFISRATLKSVIGFKSYDVLSDLCSPEAPSEKTYGDLATILKDHFAPKKLLIADYLEGVTAKLELKPKAPPKFCKARPVPYALQEAVDAEYRRRECEGIVEKGEFSE